MGQVNVKCFDCGIRFLMEAEDDGDEPDTPLCEGCWLTELGADK
jgi:hypothetical protein